MNDSQQTHHHQHKSSAPPNIGELLGNSISEHQNDDLQTDPLDLPQTHSVQSIKM